MKKAYSTYRTVVVSLGVSTILALSACAPSADKPAVPLQQTGSPQSQPTKPRLVVEEGHQIVQGGIYSEDLQAVYDDVSESMTIHGDLKITPYDGSAPLTVAINLAGKATGDSPRITLKPYLPNSETPHMNIAAKATCLGQDGDCGTSFIDIYVLYNERVYRHQVEMVSNEISKKSIPLQLPLDDKQTDNDAVDLDAEEDEGKEPLLDDNNEPIEDDDEIEPHGQYIGDVQGDLKELFDLNPKADPTKPGSQPLKEPVKTEPPKATIPEKKPLTQQEPAPAPVKTETPAKPAVPATTNPAAKPEAKPAEPTKPSPLKPDPAKPEPTKPSLLKPTPAKPAQPSPLKPEPKTEPSVIPTPKTEPKAEEKPEAPKTEETVPEEKPAAPSVEEHFNVAKKIIQVIGGVGNGSLKNALNLFDLMKKSEKPGFYISRPELKTHFGSNELIYLVQKMGKFTHENIEGYEVRVGDLSKQKGGTIYTRYKGKSIPKHRSHKNGLDADVSYYFLDPKSQGQSALTKKGAPRNDWLIEKQWELFKMFNESKLVDRIFVHRKVKRALCEFARKRGEVNPSTTEGLAFETLWRLQPRPSDHADHFHLRVKCSSMQLSCAKPMAEPPRKMGCF